MGITPSRSPAQRLSLEAAERICFFKDDPHQRTKLSIRLSRGVPMRTLHETSVDKRRTPEPAKSKSTKVAQQKHFSSTCADPSGLCTALEDATGEGYQELRPPVSQKRSSRPELDVYRSRFEPLSCASGPLGLRRVVRQLQGHSRRFL